MVARQNLLLPLVGCLLGFDLSAHAMPTPRARPKEPFSTEEDWHSFWNWKHDQVYQNNVKHQSWIESFQKLECPGMNQNDEYFWKKGSKEFARLPLSNPWDNIKNNGGNNYNIYSVDAKKFTFGGKEYKGDYLVKAVDITSDEGKIVASCEPHAMEQLGIPHHTGILIDRANGQEVGAILMKQKPGGAVVENELWLDAGQEEQQAALASVRVKTKKQLHKYAFETKSNEDRLLPG
ncbi:hypothetical protein C8R42DRAFT_466338 [Lentinula raphanica]|nr:hypothetical protein C8R42DRAFT_466338 [Lentinula raphanica]